MSREEPRSPSPGGVARATFCCELPAGPLAELFADECVIDDLRALGAEVSLATIDLGEERAVVVRKLNEAGVPVIAWLVTERSEGYFAHLDNAPEVAARYAAFRRWAEAGGLDFSAVALDVEPPIEQLEALASPRCWAVLRRWVARAPDVMRYAHARRAYHELLARIQEDGCIDLPEPPRDLIERDLDRLRTHHVVGARRRPFSTATRRVRVRRLAVAGAGPQKPPLSLLFDFPYTRTPPRLTPP